MSALALFKAMDATNTYSEGMMAIIAEHAVRSGSVEEFDARARVKDLHTRACRGETFFSLDRRLFLATRRT